MINFTDFSDYIECNHDGQILNIIKNTCTISENTGGWISIYNDGRITFHFNWSEVVIPATLDAGALVQLLSSWIACCSGGVVPPPNPQLTNIENNTANTVTEIQNCCATQTPLLQAISTSVNKIDVDLDAVIANQTLQTAELIDIRNNTLTTATNTATIITDLNTQLNITNDAIGKTYFQRMVQQDFLGTVGGANGSKRKPLTIGVEEVIWEYSSATYPFPAAANVLDLVSDNANDDGIGLLSGAQIVTIVGLDTLGNLVFDIVTLNGLTPVTSAVAFLRILTTYVAVAGSSGFNEGNITVSHLGNVIDYVAIGNSISTKAVGTVPTNYGMLLKIKMIASETDDTKSAPIRFRIYNRDINTGVIQRANEYTTKSDVEMIDLPVNGFNDVWVTAQCDTVAAVASAEIMLHSILFPV